MKSISTLALLLALTPAYADDTLINDQVKISNILKLIPSTDKDMSYKNIGDRLPKLGLSVKSISIGKLQADEINESGGLLKKGDALYSFFTNEPNEIVSTICPIQSLFVFLKRGNKWLPWDRTSNFIMHGYGYCKAP
ncbi:MAG: hypothetical protein ACXWAT_15920 [Methylobacter sp.]